MTRKDSEAIAHILRVRADMPNVYDHATVVDMAQAIASYLSTTNPRFDAGRFMRVAGL